MKNAHPVIAQAEVWTIPTYPVPAVEEMPMFAELRGHQGTSGNPYPSRVVQKVDREHRADRDYTVIRLENDYRVLERDGQRLVIAGVDDPNGPADQKTAPELVREIRSAYGEDVFILALCHRNDQLPLWAGLDVPVVLAGHAHGGIVRLPGLGGVFGTHYEFFPGDDAGLYALCQPRSRPEPKIADPRLQCTGAAGADARARGDINFF